MSDRPLITMCLIAKNEQANIERCFSSWWADVDEVVPCDTGSTDGTVETARRFARGRGERAKLKVVRHKWADDFSAARQKADDAATGQWVAWADLDDTVTGLGRLRKQAEAAPDDLFAFFARYVYATDQDGNPISELWRERLVRNDGTRWEGRLHEHKLVTHGAVVKVDPTIAQWVHHRDHLQRTGERNTRILEKWDRDEPNNPRILQSLALEYMGSERAKDSSDTFERFLALPGSEPDKRAQAHRHMCVMLMMQNRVDDARAAAFQALSEHYGWADTHLTLAEVEQTRGRPDLGYLHAQTALGLGQPDTLLIINPLQYTVHPRALMAVCLAQMGRFEEAVKVAEEALAIAPSYQLVGNYLPSWRGQLRRHNAREAVLALADVLIESGELLKAREILDAAPWYVTDEERIVHRRGHVHHLILERKAAATPAPVDEAADAFVQRHLAAA